MQFSNDKVSSYGGLFLIEKFCEKHWLYDIIGWCLDKKKLYNNSRFEIKDLIRLDVEKTLIDHRATTDIKFLEQDQYFVNMHEKLPWKSTISDHQNAITMKDCYQIREWLLSCVKLFPELIYSTNWYITFDYDTSDLACYWKQEWTAPNKHYWENMYYPLNINIHDWLVPIFWELRPWNLWPTSNIKNVITEVDSHLAETKWYKNESVLHRWDAWFQSNEIMSYAEERNQKYLLRIKSNSIVSWEAVKYVQEHSFEEKKEICYFAIKYKAESWTEIRTVVVEYTPWTLVWNLFGEYKYFVNNLYGEEIFNDESLCKNVIELYHQRWTMEHPFHDLKSSFQTWRTNSHWFYANEYKYLVTIIAMFIYTTFRETCLQATELAKSYFSTIYRRIIDIPVKIVSTWRKVIMKIVNWTKKAFMFTKILEANELFIT